MGRVSSLFHLKQKRKLCDVDTELESTDDPTLDFSTILTTVFCPEVLSYPGNLSVKGFSLLTGVNCQGKLCCNPNLLQDNLCSRLEISR